MGQVVGLPSKDMKAYHQLQKRCTRLAAASDKAYQLLAHSHDIAEILLKGALKHKKSNKIKSNHFRFLSYSDA